MDEGRPAPRKAQAGLFLSTRLSPTKTRPCDRIKQLPPVVGRIVHPSMPTETDNNAVLPNEGPRFGVWCFPQQ
jgi:hypothetical protein